MKNLPKGWEIKRLSQLIERLDSGVSVNGEAIPVKSHEKGVLKISSVTYGVFDPNENKKIIPEDVGRERISPKMNRILMSRANTPEMVGASAYLDREYTNLFLPDKLWQLEPKSEIEISMRWLSFLLSSRPVRTKLSDLATGSSSSMQNITKGDVLAIKLLLPPLPEQKAIADLLSTWDSAIEKTERLIAAKEKRFQWLLDELINQNPDKSCWKSHTFSAIFKQQRNKYSGMEPCEVLSVTKDGIVLQSEYFNKEVASEDLTGYLIVERDEFVMSGLNFWMGSVDFQTIVDKGLVSPAYKVFKVISNTIDLDFLKIFVRTSLMTNLLISVSVQGASIVRRNLDREMLENSVIKAPSLSVQKEIACTISSAKKEIDLLKSIAEKYKEQKRGLMQKLLTGEWRVKVA